MRRFALLIVCSLLIGAIGAEAAPLSGSAEWQYGGYRAKEGGHMVLDGRYFSQQYSLFYEKQGKIQNGRGGFYSLGLGGEWTGLESEINGDSVSIDTAKVFYRGDLLLAPGGLPFRLHLYSHDMHRTLLLNDYQIPFSTVAGQGEIFTPGLANNLNNGQHVISGATLLVGIRNGSYLGAYRDVLSQLPRLLVDYREEYVRDLKSRTPQHYRDRNLAFVSLNKKDNWAHYRVRDFQDFENSRENYTEKTYMLGTVDHNMQRQWINLTNWMRISADGSYTESDRGLAEVGDGSNTEADRFLPEAGDGSLLQPSERFDLNLFSTARRTNWDAATFTTFNRRREFAELAKEFEVPFMANGEFNRNTAWRFNFLGSRYQQQLLSRLDQQRDKDVVYAATRLETFRQGRYILAPHLAAENKSGDEGEGNAVRAGLEYYSNRAYNPRHDLFGAYTLARFAGTSISGNNVDYWEQELTGRIDSRLTSRLRTGLEEKLLLGSGELDDTASEHIVPRGSRGLLASSAELQQRDGSLLRSTTTWFGEYTAASRLTNRLELIYDYLRTDGEAQDQVILNHSLRYNQRNMKIGMRNKLIFGDAQQAASNVSQTLNTGSVVASPDVTYNHTSDLTYAPGRQWEAAARFDYDWSGGNGNESSRARFTQSYLYNVFTINGLVRKLADLREEFELERFDTSDGVTTTATFLMLRANYYPSSRTLLGATLFYRLFSPEDNDELSAELTAGVNFQKLVVSLDYGYGTRSAGDSTPERQEHRWQAKIKKIF